MITNKGQLALIAYNRRQKGKTYAERFGPGKAAKLMKKRKHIYAKISRNLKGVSMNERYGVERAAVIRAKLIACSQRYANLAKARRWKEGDSALIYSNYMLGPMGERMNSEDFEALREGIARGKRV